MSADGGDGRGLAAELGGLRRLVGLAMGPPAPSAWDSPTAPQRRSAALAYLLLGRGSQDAESFLTGGLDQLLRELGRASAARVVADSRGLRGRVLWAATIAARAEQGYAGTTLLYREVRHQFDSLENQLLRYVVEELYAGLIGLPAALRGSLCYFPGPAATEPVAAEPRLQRIEAALRRARASLCLRDATLPARIEARHLARAETARNEGYGRVSQIYRQYTAMRDPLGWRQAIGRAGRGVLVLPTGEGPEAMLWIELAAIALLGQ